MIINTVETLKPALNSILSTGVDVERTPTTITALMNIGVDKLQELKETLVNVDIDVVKQYPIARTSDVKLSIQMEDDWLLQSIVDQEIPTVSIKY